MFVYSGPGAGAGDRIGDSIAWPFTEVERANSRLMNMTKME